LAGGRGGFRNPEQQCQACNNQKKDGQGAKVHQTLLIVKNPQKPA
jgi:hypothetical protein